MITEDSIAIVNKIRQLGRSSRFLDNLVRLGKRPDGEYRLRVYPFHIYHYARDTDSANAIKRVGFLPEFRNPLLFGSSFVPEPEFKTFAGLFKSKVLIKAYLIGTVWDPSDNETRPMDVYNGFSADPLWNALVHGIARRLRMPPEYYKHWTTDLRIKFAALVINKLHKMGIDGVQAGAELIVVNPKKIVVVS